MDNVNVEAAELARRLIDEDWRVVFAESCTAGLAPALLAAVPGISAHLCGSWVTYREECKHAWLGVPLDLLREKSAVSPEVTRWMAHAALQQTASAQFSAAITGHLGPDSPKGLDGVCFLAISHRVEDRVELRRERQIVLRETSRIARQHEAARRLLAFLTESLDLG